MGSYTKQLSKLFLTLVLSIRSSNLALTISPQSQFAHAFLGFKNKNLQPYGDQFHVDLLPSILINNSPRSRDASQGLTGVEISRIIQGHATNTVYERSYKDYYGRSVPSTFKTILSMEVIDTGETYVEAKRGIVVNFQPESSSEIQSESESGSQISTQTIPKSRNNRRRKAKREKKKRAIAESSLVEQVEVFEPDRKK